MKYIDSIKPSRIFFLPYVESGTLTLIGATTENPSFEVIPALLSRARVFILNEFNHEEMGKIIDRTGFRHKNKNTKEAKEWLIEYGKW
jgi:putative ATPase